MKINKKIVLIGNKVHPAIELYFHKYLSEKFENVQIYDINKNTNYNILYRIRRKLGDSIMFYSQNKDLLQFIKVEEPHVIWVFKGVEIYLSTLSKIRDLNVKLINFNADNPFIRPFVSNGGKIIEKALAYYDLHFSYSKKVKNRIEKEVGVPCELLPFGFELSEVKYNEIIKEKEVDKVCFLGSPDKERAKQLVQIADAGIEIDVYGHNWKRYINNKNITVFDSVFLDDFWKVLRKYRVQLNLFRVYNEESHNMRTFEIPAIGGIQIAPDTVENREFFIPNSEIFLFSSFGELIEKIKFLLSISKKEADIVRTSARKRCVDCDYSYFNRSEIVFNAINSLFESKNQTL